MCVAKMEKQRIDVRSDGEKLGFKETFVHMTHGNVLRIFLKVIALTCSIDRQLSGTIWPRSPFLQFYFVSQSSIKTTSQACRVCYIHKLH